MSSAFYLSATHKSSGKTIVSVALCSALSKAYAVQSFKKGPDYIDPIWLSLASGKPCINLDFWNMEQEEIIAKYQHYKTNADINIIEGNKGLYDGISTNGGNSNADMAKLLNLPVVLVIDTTGITRGIAPLLQGYINFDDTNIVGVILNKTATDRHQAKLIDAVEYYTDLTIFGAIKNNSLLTIEQRHLGLQPANEIDTGTITNFITDSANIINEQVDLQLLVNTTTQTQQTQIPKKLATININKTKNISIAIAKDKVFGFYYADDIEKFENLGVEIKYFNTLIDEQIPDADALFIGGGFPEVYSKELALNTKLLADIKHKIDNGMPTYAECGGLMYLTNSITVGKHSFAMAGVIDSDTIIHDKPIGRGYVQLNANKSHPWLLNNVVYAHEFHYSELTNINPNIKYAYKVKRGYGIDGNNDGIVVNNLLACYSHLRDSNNNSWVSEFVKFIKKNLHN